MWNYRILEHTRENDESIYYSLVECFYNEEGEPDMHTGPISFGWYEDSNSVVESLSVALRDAMRKPVLKEEDIYKNHPWDRSIEKGKLREEILREEGLWDDKVKEAGEDSYPIKLKFETGEVKVDFNKPISKEGVGAPEERDSGNGPDKEFP